MSNLKFVIKITEAGPNTPVGIVFNELGEAYYAQSLRYPPRPEQTGLRLAEPSEDGTIFLRTTTNPSSGWVFWGSNLADAALVRFAKMGIKAEMASAPLRFRP
jgi:hypothetical protein